jgi:hypothetical protein
MTISRWQAAIGIALFTAICALPFALQEGRRKGALLADQLRLAVEQEMMTQESAGDVGLSGAEQSRSPLWRFVREHGKDATQALLAEVERDVSGGTTQQQREAALLLQAIAETHDRGFLPELHRVANDAKAPPNLRVLTRGTILAIGTVSPPQFVVETLERAQSREERDWAARQILAQGMRGAVGALKEAERREPDHSTRFLMKNVISALESGTGCALAASQELTAVTLCTYYCVNHRGTVNQHQTGPCAPAP